MNRIHKTFRALAIAALPAALALSATPALADKPVNPPTLHGFCSLGDQCTDNGTNTPTDVQPPVFGFTSGGQSETGTLYIDILVPNNYTIPANYVISGALLGANTFTATLFSPTAWTSGQLDAYLGISAAPTNPIGAYLPSTVGCGTDQGCDPGATGYYVFQVSLGTQTLPSNSGANDSYLMTLDKDLFNGSYIVGFLAQSGAYGATANSGAILETSPPGDGLPEPGTWATMLLGFGAAGVAVRRSRRKKALVSQLA
jgi:hypothetical protein